MLFCITMGMLTLNACGSVAVKDETLYFDEGSSGAHVAHFLTPGTSDIEKDQWDFLREGMVCLSAQAFGDFKKEFEQMCTLITCDYQTRQIMNDFFARMEIAKTVLK
jgi:hypothetical protein